MHSRNEVLATNQLEMQLDPAVQKRKKKVRRKKIQRKLSNENEGQRLNFIAAISAFIISLYSYILSDDQSSYSRASISRAVQRVFC